jgi:hypothetical protein
MALVATVLAPAVFRLTGLAASRAKS